MSSVTPLAFTMRTIDRIEITILMSTMTALLMVTRDNSIGYLRMNQTLWRPCYDHPSIMHYSRDAFTRDGSDTIQAKDPTIQVGDAHELSPLDIIKQHNIIL